MVCTYKGEPFEVRVDMNMIEHIAKIPGTWNLGIFNPTQKKRREDHEDPTAFYCYAQVWDKDDHKPSTFLLHRYVMLAATRSAETIEGKIVDHINGYETDNRLCNLQATTQQVNVSKQRMTSEPRPWNKLGVRGVTQRKNGRFMVIVARKYRGVYNTLEEADVVATGIRHQENKRRTGRA